MPKSRILAANLQPHDVVRNLTIATVIGDRTTVVTVSAYAEDGAHKSLTFRPGARVTVSRPEQLGSTGRPSRFPLRAAASAAAVATVATLSVVLAQPAHSPEADTVRPMPFVSSMGPVEPYRPTPQPRTSTRTSREGARPTMTPESLATPSKVLATKHAIPTPPADIRISFYQDCTGHAQRCIDAGTLTMYAGRILAGHNFQGYQWLSRVPVGRTVYVISGPLAGTYRVYGHLYVGRQGGSIPDFGKADLVLQTCTGRGTGFSLAVRIR